MIRFMRKKCNFTAVNQKREPMIKSMTGYGKAEAMLETGKITVEVHSLNGKTADIGIKTSMLSGHRRERSCARM